MCLDLYIECLGFHHCVGSVIHTWDCLSRAQVMQVACKLCELSTSCLLLAFLFLKDHLPLVLLELLAYFFILTKCYVGIDYLLRDMVQVVLTCVEIMLVLTTVVSSVTIHNLALCSI